jgi:ADP-ribose pyrophosphatase YjhB (NUDIX family)
MKYANELPRGVQVILQYEKSEDPLFQKYIVVRDINDRGSGTGVKKIGLPGGEIDDIETYVHAGLREVHEETGLQSFHFTSLDFFGFYPKSRSNGWNNNALLVGTVTHLPEKMITNDTSEVSEVLIMTLEEIIQSFHSGEFHEGSIRLILLHLIGVKERSLDLPVPFRDTQF